MYSNFMGLEITYRALITSQTALNVSGQNISNANTTGYSRQIDNIQTTAPLTVLNNGKAMSIGTGSTLSSITRVRDGYIDQQYRRESSNYEYWSGREASLNMVEGLLNETSSYSLSNDLSEFWNAWSELANNPEQSAPRTVVIEKALTLVQTFHSIDQQINDLQDDLNKSVEAGITKINTIADQLRELNIQIKSAEVRGDNPNDLKDQRDVLVDQLAELVPVTVVESRDEGFTDRFVGNYKLMIGNPTETNVLVNNDARYQIKLGDVDPLTGFPEIVWDIPVTPPDTPPVLDLGTQRGSLKADLDIRDTDLENFRDQLDTLAAEIANAVNSVHNPGRGLADNNRRDFFVNTGGTFTAGDINVNPVIENNVNHIATGMPTPDVEKGDASIALAIASLASGWAGMNQIISDTGGTPLTTGFYANYTSFEDYYQGVVAKLGSDVEQSTRMAQGQSVLVTQLHNSRENLSGVSLDEEMIDIIKFQKGYSSAARLVTVLDTMLESILGMGATR